MHLDRQMSRFDTPYPSSAQLHIEQQVKLAVERKLSLFIRFDAGIGKRMTVIDIERNAVGIQFDGVRIVIVRPNGAGSPFRRIRFLCIIRTCV